MVSLATKRRGGAIAAVVTTGLLFGIALLMMRDAGPKGETNFSNGTAVSMTFYTRTTTDADTGGDFDLVNTANGKVVSQYKVSQPGREKGQLKTVNLALNEELGQMFCLCATTDDAWEGELTSFKVNGISFTDVVTTTLKLSMDDEGFYPCWRFGIESDHELVDKGHSQSCLPSKNTVSMTLRTLTDKDSNSKNDLNFVNSINDEVVVHYKIPLPGRVQGQSKSVSLALREELGRQLFCLCTTGDDTWIGEVSDFKSDDKSVPGLVTQLRLSENDSGYYPCWRFGIESNKLVDKGHSMHCSLSTTVWMDLYTKTNTNAETIDDFIFVNSDKGKVLEQYEISQPGRMKGGITTVSLDLKGDVGDLFCLCTAGDDAWDGEIHGFNVYGRYFPGEVTNLKLSTDDSGYYRCWRFGIDEESKRFFDKGHSDSCV